VKSSKSSANTVWKCVEINAFKIVASGKWRAEGAKSVPGCRRFGCNNNRFGTCCHNDSIERDALCRDSAKESDDPHCHKVGWIITELSAQVNCIGLTTTATKANREIVRHETTI